MKSRTMDTCRICLAQRKNLRSIFQFNGEISYVDMIYNITSIKINSNDGNTDKICLICCRRIQDAYELKNLIEYSEKKLLYNKLEDKSENVKKINFDSLEDIKIEIECGLIDNAQIKTEYEQPNWNSQFVNSNDLINHHHTTIKKCNTIEEQPIEFKNQLSVEDFLNTIKEEGIEDYDNDNDPTDYGYDMDKNDNDDDYIQPARYLLKSKRTSYVHRRNKPKDKEKSNKTAASAGKIKKLKIVPIVLNDVRLIPTKPKETKPRKKRKKNHYEKQTICPYCGRITKNMKSHMLVHTSERSFKCDQCRKSFYTQYNLVYHKRVHTEAKKFKCDKCTAAFHHKANLERHMMMHEDIREHLCSICSKGFKRKSAMNRHALRHSSANKNVKCELCNMSFFEKAQLRHHMRVHTGERPYNCEICSQPYSYKHDFNRHCIKKHGVFLKRRSVYVMNQEVLVREQALMKEVVLRARGVVSDGQSVNPFEGPQAAMAYQQTLQALQTRQIPVDL